MIQIVNLVVTYPLKGGNQVVAINDLCTSFFDNKINAVLGESGSGKTTLGKTILGLNKYDGSILINNKEVREIKSSNRNVSYVSQDLIAYPHMSVFNNIAFPLANMHVEPDEIRRRVFEIAEQFGLAAVLFRKPKELSIGQIQRVVIARALIKRPSLIILDEPFSNLDKNTRDIILHDLKGMFNKYSPTVIFITHDVNEALRISDYLYIMEKGRMIEEGETQKVFKSTNPKVRAYFANGNETIQQR